MEKEKIKKKSVKVTLFVIIVLFLLSISFKAISEYRQKNKVIFYHKSYNKPLLKAGGITEKLFINRPAFCKLFLVFSNNIADELVIDRSYNIIDTIGLEKYHYTGSLGTCDIDGCIIYYDDSGKIDKLIVLYCGKYQILYKDSDNFKTLLLNDDGYYLFNKYFKLE